jgi:hypothetical protein
MQILGEPLVSEPALEAFDLLLLPCDGLLGTRERVLVPDRWLIIHATTSYTDKILSTRKVVNENPLRVPSGSRRFHGMCGRGSEYRIQYPST